MKNFLGILLIGLFIISCNGQTNSEIERTVGGPCQDCEALLDYKINDINPKSIDTLPGFENNEPKIKISGTVFQKTEKRLLKTLYFTYITLTEMEFINQVSNLMVGKILMDNIAVG